MRIFLKDAKPFEAFGYSTGIDFSGCYVLPGLADVHVHLREPGFSCKETIATGTAAAARGGFTAVCAMPNLDPPPDSTENLGIQLDIIEKDALVRVIPYGRITRGDGSLAPYAALAPYVAGFSDDGRGVQDEDTMRRAMSAIAKTGKILAAHCEDESLLHGGYIHDGEYAKAHGHRGISSESEWRQLERDIRLVRETGCRYHICHVSTAESVELIRKAKTEGLPVTCETAPHYLVLCDDDLQENGRFKMNPPLRSARDREALLDGIRDGTVDIIATDHAPHTAEEKSRGLEKSAMGVVGLETALAVCYTKLVLVGVITMDRLTELMCVNPRKIFGLPAGEGFTVFDPEARYKIDSAGFLSMGWATPFEGMEVHGRVLCTVLDGRAVFEGWRS